MNVKKWWEACAKKSIPLPTQPTLVGIWGGVGPGDPRNEIKPFKRTESDNHVVLSRISVSLSTQATGMKNGAERAYPMGGDRRGGRYCQRPSGRRRGSWGRRPRSTLVFHTSFGERGNNRRGKI